MVVTGWCVMQAAFVMGALEQNHTTNGRNNNKATFFAFRASYGEPVRQQRVGRTFNTYIRHTYMCH